MVAPSIAGDGLDVWSLRIANLSAAQSCKTCEIQVTGDGFARSSCKWLRNHRLTGRRGREGADATACWRSRAVVYRDRPARPEGSAGGLLWLSDHDCALSRR